MKPLIAFFLTIFCIVLGFSQNQPNIPSLPSATDITYGFITPYFRDGKWTTDLDTSQKFVIERIDAGTMYKLTSYYAVSEYQLKNIPGVDKIETQTHKYSIVFTISPLHHAESVLKDLEHKFKSPKVFLFTPIDSICKPIRLVLSDTCSATSYRYENGNHILTCPHTGFKPGKEFLVISDNTLKFKPIPGMIQVCFNGKLLVISPSGETVLFYQKDKVFTESAMPPSFKNYIGLWESF